MSIKAELIVHLPYIIRIKEEENLNFNFDFDKFEMFHIEFIHNEADEDGLFGVPLDESHCCKIRVEVIYKNCDYKKFKVEKKKCLCNGEPSNEDFYVTHVPKKTTNEIMQCVAIELNHILFYLSYKTHMFWIEPISVNPLSGCLGVATEICFFVPQAKPFQSVRAYFQYSDYYMTKNNLVQTDELCCDTFKSINTECFNEYNFYYEYLNKAKKAIYEAHYADVIIFSSIAVESFIKYFINSIRPEDDIIVNYLAEKDNDYLNLYFNILLKYIKGKSLKEISEKTYTLLKRMYLLRNAIMHSGKLDEKALKKSGLSNLSEIDFKTCKEIIDSVEMAFKIVVSL
jgi:hypothetical protein